MRYVPRAFPLKAATLQRRCISIRTPPPVSDLVWMLRDIEKPLAPQNNRAQSRGGPWGTLARHISSIWGIRILCTSPIQNKTCINHNHRTIRYSHHDVYKLINIEDGASSSFSFSVFLFYSDVTTV
jgi:hypothetical protein